jgi:hypothetical protein
VKSKSEKNFNLILTRESKDIYTTMANLENLEWEEITVLLLVGWIAPLHKKIQ